MQDIHSIAEDIATTVLCHKSGSCVVFANELCKAAQDHDFTVVEGSVKFEGSASLPHVWIEADGKRIDPTLEQFDFFALDSVTYQPARGYDPFEFSDRIQQHRDFFRFDHLKKS